ncbi:MAG: SDR family oxidoreductase [Tannerella sp.]|jgi:NAD(P)-dependent dehydrogenase (short-subunit alcohol dehydrogenase family)|nr:SDR family oxidoreductase [Tannerella sp.]
MTFSNRSILVTGASSGIGREVAVTTANEGAFVYLTGRNRERLEATKQLAGAASETIVCELTSDEDIDMLTDKTENLDGAVLCAGINEYVPVKSISRKRLERIFDTNFYAPVLLVRQLIKKKKLNRGASVIFVSSIAACLGTPATLPYASSKAAINAAAKVMAVELAQQGIRVNVVSPGIVKSEMINKQDIEASQFMDLEKHYPLGLGAPRNVADTVKFLLSDDSAWITGANIIIDGGFTLL